MLLDNADPRLSAAWHAVLPSRELDDDDRVVALLGNEWTLSRDGDAVTAADADGNLAAAVAEKYGMVWISVSTTAHSLPELIEMDDAEFATTVISRRTHVSAGVLVDNFLDVSHFSYLHRKTFGRVAPVTVGEGIELTREGWIVRVTHATDLHEGAPAPAPRHEAGPPDPASWRVATYSVLAPFVVHLQMEFPALGRRSAATLICQPESSDFTTVYVLVAWPVGDPAGLREQADISADVLEEDLSLLERMADPRLELSLRAELHTKADRASVEYRRLVSDYLALGSVDTQPIRHHDDGEVLSLATRG